MTEARRLRKFSQLAQWAAAEAGTGTSEGTAPGEGAAATIVAAATWAYAVRLCATRAAAIFAATHRVERGLLSFYTRRVLIGMARVSKATISKTA